MDWTSTAPGCTARVFVYRPVQDIMQGRAVGSCIRLPTTCRSSSARAHTQRASSFIQRPELSNRQNESRKVATQAGSDNVGQSYANALVELAQEKNCLDDVHGDVDTLAGIFKENAEVADFLYNPMITEDKKKEVLEKLANDANLTEYMLNFLNILVDRDRLVNSESIFNAFEERYCELTDTQVATIYSAVKLEQEQQFLVAKKLQELTGSKNIKLKTVIDESLIAGFVVDYGSAQIDLSVKGQLEEVAQELVAGAAVLA